MVVGGSRRGSDIPVRSRDGAREGVADGAAVVDQVPIDRRVVELAGTIGLYGRARTCCAGQANQLRSHGEKRCAQQHHGKDRYQDSAIRKVAGPESETAGHRSDPVNAVGAYGAAGIVLASERATLRLRAGDRCKPFDGGHTACPWRAIRPIVQLRQSPLVELIDQRLTKRPRLCAHPALSCGVPSVLPERTRGV